MALFIIERAFAEKMELAPEVVAAVEAYNADADLRWLFSFLSGDGRKSYCLYKPRRPTTSADRPRTSACLRTPSWR